jgi:predicted RNA methylase
MIPQPAKDFRERAAEVAREAPMDGPSTEIYWRVISTIDPAEVAALQSRYAADLVDFKPSGMFKYLDLPFWIWRQVGVARRLGLDHGGPRNILDIGMGAGHFAAVCRSLGHTVAGTDIAVPLYDEICRLLGVDRRIEPTRLRQPLADLGLKFDLVTIVWQLFNVRTRHRDGDHEYWTTADWKFFLDDLARRHLRYPGSIWIELNTNFNSKGSANDAAFMRWSAERGAHVDQGRGRILLNHLQGPRVLRKGRKAPPPGEFASALSGGATPQPAQLLADRVDAALVGLHRERLASLGAEQSGLFHHYKVLVERGRLIGFRERGVVDLIERRLPAYQRYCVLRAGLGELALLLAASGRKVVACEPDEARVQAIEAGRAHLAALGLLVRDALEIHRGLGPPQGLERPSLGIGLGVLHVLDEAAAAPLTPPMALVDDLLIDLRLFLRLREDPAEREAVAGDLKALGFERRAEFPLRGELSWFQKRGDSHIANSGGL